MRIIGVDPGTARVGWGVVEEKNGTITPIAYGLIATNNTDSPEHRLAIIFKEFSAIISMYTPAQASIEDLFFEKNAKTAIAVGQARGVLMLACDLHQIPISTYSPVAIKKAICGSGSAIKSQVGKMMIQLLHLTTLPKPDDVADALAIAATHAYSYKLKGKLL